MTDKLITPFSIEVAQNFCNKMAAARSKFFARKIHKLKKMLQPLFTRKPRSKVTTAPVDLSSEELDNALNEALEARLSQDLSTDDLHALENGRMTVIVINPSADITVPQVFAPGRFSWTFLPSPDYDICPTGDLNALSSCQIPEQQTPPSTPF